MMDNLNKSKLKYVKPANEYLLNREVKLSCWYMENYMKCFWGLRDHHTSSHSFVTKSNDLVITEQPQIEKVLKTKTKLFSRDIKSAHR